MIVVVGTYTRFIYPSPDSIENYKIVLISIPRL